MAKKTPRPASAAPQGDPPGAAVSAADLLEMLKASARRTASSAATPGGLESFSTEAADTRLGGNPPDAVERRLKKLGLHPDVARAVATRTEAAASGFEAASEGLAEMPGLERIIGRNMLMRINYLEAGQLASRAVARVRICDARGQDRGYGTGFLVAPRLFLTNNHVFPSADVARLSKVEFNYQQTLDGRLGPTVVFDLDPDTFFVTSPMGDLDFALVALKERSSDGRPLGDFGWHPLTALTDEVLAGECVTIIQHPKGDPKQIALRKNEVLKFPHAGEQYLHYQTDTTPGSSGSPVFNDGWDVVALHHAGKPATDDDGNYLTEDGRVWNSGMGLDAIKWEANEGIRVAAIVKFVKEAELSDAQRRLFEAGLTPHPLAPVPTALRDDPAEPAPAPERTVVPSGPAVPQSLALAPGGDGSVTFTIPLQISVRLGTALVPIAASLVPGRGVTPEEAVHIDQNYATRQGYDPEFLGKGGRAVPLPKLTPALAASAAVNSQAKAGKSKYELPYHHFSVVLNKKRRLALFTAVNIDGKTATSPKREADRWFFDPRVAPEEQVGNPLYTGTMFDRGHLVRRLDPAWGASPDVVKTANDDTFHFTNCSPQHKRFNEGKNLWAGLEDYLLKTASDEQKRMTVFTGPVFLKDDPNFREVQVPRRFWKVAVTPKAGGGLVATAYVVSQEDLIKDVVKEEISAEAVARMFQVRVRKVEELTGLDFGTLRDCDPTITQEMFEAASDGQNELEGYEDIVLG